VRVLGALVGLFFGLVLIAALHAVGVIFLLVLVPLGWGLGARLARRIKGNHQLKVKP